MITGKEALIALANGEEVEYMVLNQWDNLGGSTPLSIFDRDDIQFRLKPKKISINGVEVPTPFEPEHGDIIWFLSPDYGCGYMDVIFDPMESYTQFGAWRTEAEIKQVVEALRKVFNQGEVA